MVFVLLYGAFVLCDGLRIILGGLGPTKTAAVRSPGLLTGTTEVFSQPMQKEFLTRLVPQLLKLLRPKLFNASHSKIKITFY